MYAYIKGTVEEVYEDHCVIECQGIGYNVQISSLTASKLPSLGEMTKLFTYTNVREDAFLLFGFLTKRELELFKLCISVSGIGPKGGLSILSALSPQELHFAIATQAVKTISQAPGIGKKTAERLVLELKNKLEYDEGMFEREASEYGEKLSTALPVQEGAVKEAIDALVALGYDSSSAAKAVHKVEDAVELDSGALWKKALKFLF